MFNINKLFKRHPSVKYSDSTRTESYVIDGKEYNSLSEMPEEHRKRMGEHFEIFADRDNDGTPDIFQAGENTTTFTHSSKGHSYTIDNPEGLDTADLLRNEIRNGRLFGSIGLFDSREQRNNVKRENNHNNLVQDEIQQKKTMSQRKRTNILIFALLAVILFLLIKQ